MPLESPRPLRIDVPLFNGLFFFFESVTKNYLLKKVRDFEQRVKASVVPGTWHLSAGTRRDCS